MSHFKHQWMLHLHHQMCHLAIFTITEVYIFFLRDVSHYLPQTPSRDVSWPPCSIYNLACFWPKCLHSIHPDQMTTRGAQQKSPTKSKTRCAQEPDKTQDKMSTRNYLTTPDDPNDHRWQSMNPAIQLENGRHKTTTFIWVFLYFGTFARFNWQFYDFNFGTFCANQLIFYQRYDLKILATNLLKRTAKQWENLKVLLKWTIAAWPLRKMKLMKDLKNLKRFEETESTLNAAEMAAIETEMSIEILLRDNSHSWNIAKLAGLLDSLSKIRGPWMQDTLP